MLQVVEGVGIEGWVECNGDWVHVSVGNERLFKQSGVGKVRLNKSDQQSLDRYLANGEGTICIFVVVEDELHMALSLAGEACPSLRFPSVDFSLIFNFSLHDLLHFSYVKFFSLIG